MQQISDEGFPTSGSRLDRVVSSLSNSTKRKLISICSRRRQGSSERPYIRRFKQPPSCQRDYLYASIMVKTVKRLNQRLNQESCLLFYSIKSRKMSEPQEVEK